MKVADGFALPLVLIVLALLTSLSFGLTRMAAADSDLVLNARSDWEEELRIRGVVETVALRLLVGNYDAASLVHPDGDLPLNNTPVQVGEYSLRIQNWAGLYSLPLLGVRNVEAILRKMLDKRVAAEVAAELADWIDPDSDRTFNGAESADYDNAGLSQRPRNAALRSIDELQELPSVSPAMMYGSDSVPGLRDIFLAGGDDNFDLGTAPDLLVGPVLGVSDSVAQEINDARRRGSWSEVRFLIDEEHWAFNYHAPFQKGTRYRVMIESDRFSMSRIQFALTPAATEGLYSLVDWQLRDPGHE